MTHNRLAKRNTPAGTQTLQLFYKLLKVFIAIYVINQSVCDIIYFGLIYPQLHQTILRDQIIEKFNFYF